MEEVQEPNPELMFLTGSCSASIVATSVSTCAPMCQTISGLAQGWDSLPLRHLLKNWEANKSYLLLERCQHV